MVLALDASTPAMVTGTSNPITTASFSPPANSALFAICMGDTSDTFSMSGGTGLSWSSIATRNAGGSEGTVTVFFAWNASAQTSITLSSTRTGTFNAVGLKVLVVTGAESTYGGATANGATSTASVTTTVANSWVWAGCVDENAGSYTAATGCTTNDAWTSYGGISSAVAKRTTFADPSSTAEVTGWVSVGAPTTVAFEIRPASGGGGGAGPITTVGTLQTHTNNTSAATESITLVPAAVGNLICLAIETKWATLGTDDFSVASMSGGGVSTWNQRLVLNSADNIHRAELWWGVVTATGSSTLTVTYTSHASLGTGASSIDAQEFSYSNAGTIWIMDVTGTSDPNTNVTTMPWPTLAPKMGLGNEAYFGYMAVTGTVTATGLTGFTFTTDARGNPCAVSATVSASVSPQATGTSQKYFSVGMLIAATVAADLPQATNSPRARLTRASCF